MTNEKIPKTVERWLDDLYAELFGPLESEGGEKAMRCPNCDEEMEYDEDSGCWVCPNCGYSEQRD